jgi:hypothetical protein
MSPTYPKSDRPVPDRLRILREILPGILHWTAFHEGIRQDVSSYYVRSSGTLLDPIVPQSLDPLAAEWPAEPPERIVLTNRHHYRESARFVEAFGCPVLCHEAGLHEFEDGPEVAGFAFGDELAPGITAVEVDAICPEETALLIEGDPAALAFADGLVHYGRDGLGFVADFLMGDDPEGVKAGLLEAFQPLLELEFDALLFAHGNPIAVDGHRLLEAFLDSA